MATAAITGASGGIGLEGRRNQFLTFITRFGPRPMAAKVAMRAHARAGH